MITHDKIEISHHFYYLYLFNSIMYFELDNDDIETSFSFYITNFFTLKCFKCFLRNLFVLSFENKRLFVAH